MSATISANKKAAASCTFFAFTPRQVLLTNQTMKQAQSSSNVKLLLHQSIVRYLDRNGFSKTLKKFRSEAQFEKDNSEGSSIDLEEMCVKYLEICGKDAKSKVNDQNEQVAGAHLENKEEGKSKEKKKKKSKLVSESLANVEVNQLESQPIVTEKKGKDDKSVDATIVSVAETEKRSKDKKKKKDKIRSQGDAIDHIGDLNETVSKKDDIKAVTDEEKKDSKKRKRPTSEENGQQVAEKTVDEEPKRRKKENLNESKGGEQLAKTSGNLGSESNSNKENVAASGQVVGNQLEKQSDGQTNGHLESAGEKSSTQRSQKKQQKESAEQKSAKKAFQRVQVDKVAFSNERLQDNSYWAKDGAENGYGAKAEEILGQVRGRDFRHEKTKKKRGTYRGGQIDLQSHSIKFNYSDDE